MHTCRALSYIDNEGENPIFYPGGDLTCVDADVILATVVLTTQESHAKRLANVKDWLADVQSWPKSRAKQQTERLVNLATTDAVFNKIHITTR